MVTKKKEKTPEQKAKMKMSQVKNQIRNALAEGDEKKAFALLGRNGIQDILECRLPKEYQSPAEQWFVEYDKRTKPPEMPSNGGAKDIFAPEVVAAMPVPVVAEPFVGDLTPLEGQDIAFPSNEPTIEQNAATEGAGETLKDPATLTADDFVLGWPKRVEAVVWGFVRNPKLCIILLPDGRKASMWKSRFRTHRIHDKVTAQLEQSFLMGERQGDPAYEDVSQRSNTW